MCMRPLRLTEADKASLGLQPHVGATEHDAKRAQFYRGLELLLSKEVKPAGLAPLQRIGFDGRAPLDYLYFQSRDRLEYWEWIAGKRFEYDWQRARTDAPVTVSLDGLMLAKVARPTAEQRRRERLNPTTFRPAAGRRVRSKPELGDSRLDAMARIGRLQDEVSKISFWLLEQVIGTERTLKQVAELLGEDQRYVGRRFREALWDAAGHYRMVPSSRPRRR
jgi:hypothetical protein